MSKFSFSVLFTFVTMTMSFCSAHAQVVLQTRGSMKPSTATELNLVPSTQGELEVFAIPDDGASMYSIETVAPNAFLARLDFVGDDGNPAWIDYMFLGDSGDSLIVGASGNVDLNDAFTSNLLLGGPGWIPQDAIYIVDSAGTVHKPVDHDGFVDVIEGIEHNGNTITTCIIKGHGSNDLIGLGPDAILTCNGGVITVTPIDPNDQPTDVTDTLNEVCDANTVIRFRGCFTKPLADDVENALGGEPDVKGAIRFVIGIPWTRWGAGVYR